jgi:Tetratricopeptide repeat.
MAENIYEIEGDKLLKSGDTEEAIESYTQAIKQEPHNAKLYLKRAAAEDIEGMADEFFEDYTKATKLAPNTAEFYYAKSHLTYSFSDEESDNNFTPSKEEKLEALDYANKAIELDPYYAAAYDWRAFLKKELEDYQGALEEHNKAIELTNDYYNYYFFRGETYLKLKDYGAAIQDYTKAIGLNPNCSIAYNQRSFAKKKIGDTIGANEDSKKVKQLGVFKIYNLPKFLIIKLLIQFIVLPIILFLGIRFILSSTPEIPADLFILFTCIAILIGIIFMK